MAWRVFGWRGGRGDCWGEIEGERPQGEGGGEDIGVGESALREPDGEGGGEQGDDEGGEVSGEPAREAKDGEESGGGDDADEGAGAADDISGEVPPGGEEDRGERRMGVGDGGLRDERAGAEEVEGGRDVIAALVPEVGEAEQCPMTEEDHYEEERVQHPEPQCLRGLRGVAEVGTDRGGRHDVS